jgi:hypothetical protein
MVIVLFHSQWQICGQLFRISKKYKNSVYCKHKETWKQVDKLYQEDEQPCQATIP